jgi:hypothetical protein
MSVRFGDEVPPLPPDPCLFDVGDAKLSSRFLVGVVGVAVPGVGVIVKPLTPPPGLETPFLLAPLPLEPLLNAPLAPPKLVGVLGTWDGSGGNAKTP